MQLLAPGIYGGPPRVSIYLSHLSIYLSIYRDLQQKSAASCNFLPSDPTKPCAPACAVPLPPRLLHLPLTRASL
eukprot:scaffold100878_cov81-Phaeocystis_antarctica.AAC.6